MAPDVELRPAERGDREYVESTLERCGLPTADLETALEHLFVCSADGRRIGVGGLEPCAEYALLRSVAVEPSARGEGYGTAITERLLEHAREDGFSTTYLLTTTAADFFADRGFEPVDRAAVPEPVCRTEEFTDICPSTAMCMRHDLE
ncbi:arsenic resistance N-acetyltransferase ArsN2 [Natronobeatus ordinarius]|uniref:arsenic resistance N-acetyltransferase ArsN2 n=1 Tax=Natronobeatus ordinarius TaxID=2963433 RepID=UPI0020CE02F7|nr:arsenic resistance N-acetyltransferase ArsN2 [Natronobeatus ordinarius]